MKTSENQPLRVPKQYRVNPLSHVEGGSEVQVNYVNGKSFLYDNIKNVKAYCGAIHYEDIKKGLIHSIYSGTEVIPLSSIINYKDRRSKKSYVSKNTNESYGNYAGTYAQDVEGLSDDFINDVLDGCPEAYWNID